MSAPGSPTSARRSPQPSVRNEYVSSYSDHFNSNTPRPSSAPASTTPRRHLQYDTPSSSYTPSPFSSSSNNSNILAPTPLGAPLSPSTPRNHPSASSFSSLSISSPRYDATNDVSMSPTSRYAKYSWNKQRNPLLDGEGGPRSPTGRKSVPGYFDNLEKEDEDTKRLSRKSKPEPTPFMIDPSRAGIPTLIQKIRTHEEDIYYKKRPSTAPSPSILRDDVPPAGATPRHYSRRPCQIEKFNVKRNPLIESGEYEQPRRQLIGFNKQSESEVQFNKKTIVVPPSLQKVSRTTEYFIPGEHPQQEPVRLRINHPDDSDVFNASHPLNSRAAPHLMGAIEREQAQKEQEVALDRAYQERVSFYNDEIKKFKAKAKLKSGGV